MNENIYAFMRSMYRYNLLLGMEDSPSILVEMEKDIFKKRFIKLSVEERSSALEMWPEFLKEAMVEDAKLNAAIDEDLKSFQPN